MVSGTVGQKFENWRLLPRSVCGPPSFEKSTVYSRPMQGTPPEAWPGKYHAPNSCVPPGRRGNSSLLGLIASPIVLVLVLVLDFIWCSDEPGRLISSFERLAIATLQSPATIKKRGRGRERLGNGRQARRVSLEYGHSEAGFHFVPKGQH
jgi:hypothetical protein